MSVRQEDVNSAMLSILKKMDVMVTATQQTYEQSLITLGSVETIMKVDVGAELKKQTGILMSIEAKLGKQSKGEGGGGDKGNIKDFKEAFGSVAEALDKILKAAEKIDSKKSKNLKEFFTKLSESINEFSKNVDAGKAKAAADLIAAVSNGVLKYALVLTLATPLLIIALPGAMLFGLSIRVLMASMGKVDKNQVEAMKAVLALAKGALLYSMAMVLVTLLSPIVLIGSVLFGLSIRLLMMSAGTVNKKDVKGMEAVLALAKGALLYSLAMVVVSVLSPIVLVGSILFGLSIRLLMKTTGAVDKSTVEGMHAVMGLARGAILYSLAMVVVSVLSPIVLVGSVLFGLSIRMLLKTTGEVDEKRVEGMKAVLALAKGALLYSLAMVVVSVLSPIVLVGSVLFGLSIRLLLKSTGDIDEKRVEGMKAVLALAKGALLYSLAMVVVSVLSPIVLVGSVLFGLSIRLLLKSTGEVDEKRVAAMNSVLALAKGALLYSLAMVVVTLLSPVVLIGSVVLGLSIQLLMATVGSVKKKDVQAMEAVLALAKGALLYSLAMVVVSVLSPIVLVGSILFGLSIRLLMATSGAVGKNQVKAMEAVLALAKGALLYSLAMVVVTVLSPVVLIGSIILGISLRILAFGLRAIGDKESRRGIRALAVLSIAIFAFSLVLWAFPQMVDFKTAAFTFLTIGGFGILFFMLGKAATTIYKGALAMLVVGFSILILSVALMVFKASKFNIMDALVLGITITGLGAAMFIAGKFFKEIALGSISMIIASVAVIVLSMGLAIFKASKFELEDALSLGAAITVVGLAFGIAGAGPIPGFIMLGAIAMILAGASLMVLSLGLGAFKLTGFKLDDALSLGAAIGAVSATMSLAGLASPLIILGAVAMTLASVALLPITGALALFKASGFKKEDGDNLQSALGSVISGFLGGPMPGGLIASLKFAAQAAARAVLLLVTVPPMILAGAALITISAGLSSFKKSGFTKADGENIEFMIGSVARAFTIITDKKRQKEMGLDFNPSDLMIGIMSLSQAGNVLSSLAAGVQAWANLEVYDWQVINPGTAKAKLVIAGKRKLNKTDFENAAYGMSQVISAIAAPFADVGKLEMGESSGNPILDSVFGGGFVSKGISALSKSGNTLVALAQGVQAFANLEITEYEVVNPGTKDAILVPKEKRKLSDPEIEKAGINISKIINVVAEAFAKVGESEANTKGIFSGGFVSKGVKALAGIGENLTAMTDSVIKMAFNEIPQFDLIGGGTKDAKLVPGKPLKITSTDLLAAAKNIDEIINVVAEAFSKVGKSEANTKGIFAGKYVSKGVKALAGIGEILTAMTDNVIKMANSEITTYKVEKGKLVPISSRKMNSKDFKKAAYNIDTILGILIDGIAKAGKKIESNQDSFDLAVDSIPNMTKTLASMAKPIEDWSKLTDVDKVGSSISSFLVQIQSNFDPTKNTEIISQDKYFTSFVKNIETMSNETNAMTKIAENFDKIQKSMKLTKESINSMDLKKLTLTDSLMKSLAAIAKNPEAMAKAVEGGINEAFQQLAKALEELGNKQSIGLKNVANNMPKAPALENTQKPVTKQPMGNPKTSTATTPTGSNTMQRDLIAALTAYGAAKDR